MPEHCCRPDYDATFDARSAERELSAYRRSGPAGTTRGLVEAIRAQGVEGSSVLDIGGGIGVIGAELLTHGASRLTDVDAARHYLAAYRDEIGRLGFADRATFLHGDFTELAAEVPPADVVTLDRVVCCYGDWRGLVDAAADHATRLLGLVYPLDRPWTRLIVGAGNLVNRVTGRNFRFHVHPEREIDARIRGHGLMPVHRDRGLAWQTVVYARAPSS